MRHLIRQANIKELEDQAKVLSVCFEPDHVRLRLGITKDRELELISEAYTLKRFLRHFLNYHSRGFLLLVHSNSKGLEVSTLRISGAYYLQKNNREWDGAV